MSWHRVQHAQSTASTQDWLCSFHSHDYKLTPDSSFSFGRASLHDRPQTASSPWELKCNVTLSHSHGCELTNWWIESQHPARRPSTASQDSSKLARWRPPNTLVYGLEVYVLTRLITASKLPRSRPLCVSPNPLDYGPQVCTIMPSLYIVPNSLDCGLQVYFQTRSITTSKFAQSWPPRASTHSRNHGLQVHLQTCSMTPCKCISKRAQSRPPSASTTHSITASQCISVFTW